MGITSTTSLQARSVSLVRLPFEFLHFFLRESLFCWILDGDLQFAAPTRGLSLVSPGEESSTASSSSARLTFQMLEEKLAQGQSRQPTLSIELPTRGYSSAPTSSVSSPVRRRQPGPQIKPDFQAFCEQLVEAHRLREWQKEIKRLQCALKASKKAHSRSTFDTFCHEVLLTTELSKKRREVRELREAVESAKLERTDANVKAASQTVIDSQEDRFAQQDSEPSVDERRAVDTERAEHETELLEVIDEWRKESTMLRRELELLKLSQATHSLEQEMSNELEERLFKERRLSREGSFADEASFRGKATADDGYSTDDTDVDLEDMTTMSSSSTCVGSPSPSPRKKNTKRVSSYSRKSEPREFTRFSFNPLYYGVDGALSKRRSSNLAPSLVSRPPWRG